MTEEQNTAQRPAIAGWHRRGAQQWVSRLSAALVAWQTRCRRPMTPIHPGKWRV